MVADMVENSGKGALGRYSIYPSFPCFVFLQGEKYSECCCKLEAKEQLFSLVHLIGYRREDVKVIDPKTNEEMFI